MNPDLELKCEICKSPALGVASSCMGAISHAYCRECLEAHREVWSTLVGGLYGCEKDCVADWVKPIIVATCAFYKKTEDDLWQEVEELVKEYDDAMRRSMDDPLEVSPPCHKPKIE